MNATFNSKAAREFVQANKKDNGLDAVVVIDAINSIEKRIEYLKYFYGLFREVADKDNLVFDHIGVYKDNNGFVFRHKYEATAFAFLSNLHEMIDSYPFIYFGINSDKTPKKSKIVWDDLAVNNENLKSKITSLKGNRNFSILKDLNNYRKHGALPKIKNQVTYLEININFKGQENYKNLTDLLHELYDQLIPQYFDILALTFKSQ